MNYLMKSLFIIFCFLIISCESSEEENGDKQEINQVMNMWHESASKANYDSYFDAMDKKSVFIGTDAGENWVKEEFQSFSKPYFDKGKAWSFKVLERNVYFSKSAETAWFDELLDTWMGTCRGSGVLEREDGTWKIKHYVLSVCIPNETIEEVIAVKSLNDSLFRAK
jgi:hypothetical protein